MLTLMIMIASSCVLIQNNEKLADTKGFEEPDSFEVSDEILVLEGWSVNDNVNVRDKPSESSDIIGSLMLNDKVTYTIYSSDWFEIEYDGRRAYVSSEYISDNIVAFKTYDVPYTRGFKSYMDYRKITYQGSRQYELQNKYAYTGDYGIRMVNGRYCVAVGSRFTSDVGQYFDLILENGTVIPCILSDQKADAHTDSDNIITMHNGCMSEFVVDTNSLNDMVRISGNISECNDSWNSKVVQVRVYDKNIFKD